MNNEPNIAYWKTIYIHRLNFFFWKRISPENFNRKINDYQNKSGQ